MMSERARLAAIVVIWGIFGLLAMTMLIVQEQNANFIIFGIMAVAALVATDTVIKSDKKEDAVEEAGKAKRTPNSDTASLLALLDEDDIAELRSRVKRRLLDSIEGGSDGELSSLDHLLVEQQSRQQKR